MTGFENGDQVVSYQEGIAFPEPSDEDEDKDEELFKQVSEGDTYTMIDFIRPTVPDSSFSIVDNANAPPVPLRSEGKGAEFAATIDPRTNSQIVIVADKNGGLTLLEQDSSSRLWKDSPPLIFLAVTTMSSSSRTTPG